MEGVGRKIYRVALSDEERKALEEIQRGKVLFLTLSCGGFPELFRRWWDRISHVLPFLLDEAAT